MRYLTILGFLTLAALLAAPAQSAAMQIPGGSYQQTCRGSAIHGSKLVAECQDRNGKWRRTSLDNFQSCRGQIQNIDGALECTPGANPSAGERFHGATTGPRGSYAQTCQHVTTFGTTLRASCQDRNGRWRETSLNDFQRCSSDIQNDNGRLRCHK